MATNNSRKLLYEYVAEDEIFQVDKIIGENKYTLWCTDTHGDAQSAKLTKAELFKLVMALLEEFSDV